MSMATVDEQNRLSDDVLEVILSDLSITDAVNAALVCNRWRSLLSSSPSLPLIHANKPWLFVFDLSRPMVSTQKQLAWGFDPLARRWIRLPPLRLQSGGDDVDVLEGNGVVFGILEGSRMRYCTEMVRRKWEETPPMRRCRNHPVVTFINTNNNLLLFVVGGVYREFELEGEEESGSSGVEMYDVRFGEWMECPPLPPHFKSAASSTCMSSALLHDNRIYIWEKYSGECCCFHLGSMQWGSVMSVGRPSGVRSASLLACSNRLILAGLSQQRDGDGGVTLSFDLWSVSETSMDCAHVASMPAEILNSFLVDGHDEEEDDTTKVECKAMGDLIYVFPHHDCAIRHRNPPVCVCDLSKEDGIVWQKLPSLASSVNPLDRMVYMCSPVTMDQICLSQI